MDAKPRLDQVVNHPETACTEQSVVLLKALHRLRSDLARVESEHLYLKSDLSSLCAAAIAQLSAHGSANEVHPAAAGHTSQREACQHSANLPTSPVTKPGNLLSKALDTAGGHLITCLDRTGDGIIYCFSKLVPPVTSGRKSVIPPDPAV